VEDHGAGVGVGPQVEQLVGGVAVVGVDRGQPELERGEHGLEVLGARVEVLRDARTGFEALLEQPGREGVGPLVEALPGRAAIPLDERHPLRLHLGDRLPHLGEVPARHGHVPCSSSFGHRPR
jgi:hypothetical protein